MKKGIFRNEEEVKRGFFHELGHYISFTLNGIDVEKISIYRCENDGSFLCGSTKPVKPIDSSKQIPIVPPYRLPYFIANQFHGCIFQILFFNPDLTLMKCMQKYGSYDLYGFKYQLNQNKLKAKESEIIDFICNYLETLKGYEFIEIKQIDLDGLIIENEGNITVDLKILKNRLETFLLNYSNTYNELILGVKKIIDVGVVKQ